jgi:hypothetical protein
VSCGRARGDAERWFADVFRGALAAIFKCIEMSKVVAIQSKQCECVLACSALPLLNPPSNTPQMAPRRPSSHGA